MKSHEKLLEEYEDALFALLMEPVAEQEGAAALEMNEHLKNDPSAAVPEEMTRAGLRTIRREFSKRRGKRVLEIAGRAFGHVAVFLLFSTLCFATVCAAMPEVRVRTLNLIVEVSEIATNLTLGDSSEINAPQNSLQSTGVQTGPGSALAEDGTLGGYQMPELPEEYRVTSSNVTSRGTYITYLNEMDEKISFRVEHFGSNGSSSIDTENAIVENIQVNGYDGLYVEKNNRLQVVWGDTDQGNLIGILATGISKEEILHYAETMKFVGIT